VDRAGTLYVADNVDNRIAAIPQALTRADSAGAGATLTQGEQLANPLGLVLAPNGDLLAANATNGKIVEITPSGKQVGEYYAIQDVGQDPPGNGDLFDLAINQAGTGVLFVKDDTNTLALVH
jgi:DNA-binding beta-propeller fold protein YncE